MRTTQPNRTILTALSLAMLAIGATSSHAADRSTQRDGARVIQLHAPNHTTRTFVVWTRKAPPQTASAASARPSVQPKSKSKSISLPAGNGPVQSLTVWTKQTQDAFEVAPLK
jgi:hypothetical protein